VNPIGQAVHRVDAFQQRHTVPALAFGVIQKFGDDSAGGQRRSEQRVGVEFSDTNG
jgi:hypothetical protein